ncbi:MAG: hypothetical protein RBS80_06325 [Thermoguttaceae bacterium]|jgi:hypothetical protein|nr:hypothetical protein [Thermoguttaceae bacterium]
MSGFFGGTKRFVLPILSLAMLAAVSLQANAEGTCKGKSSSIPAPLAFLSDWWDVLNQYGRAAWRLADSRQVMLVRVVDTAGEPIAGADVRSFTITHIRHGSSTSFILDNLKDTLCRMAFTQADGTARVVRPTSKDQGVLSTASDPVTIRDGRLPKWLSPPTVVDATRADGRFELPKPLEPYVVGVVHDSGGAEIAADVLESRGEIVLQPWARVEGEFQGPPDESLSPDGEERIRLGINCAEDADSDKPSERPHIDWSCTCDVTSSRRFVFERVLPGRAEAEVFSSDLLFIAGEVAPVWRTQKFTAVAGQTSHIVFGLTGRTVTGHVALPAGSAREFAPAVGYGLIAFQRPLVPVPPEIAGQPAEAREAWERQWLESEAGMAADRAAQNHWFRIDADGSFKMDSVASGVYRLAVELRRAGETPDEPGEEIAWLVEEVTLPDAVCDGPFDLGTFTVNVASLFCGDAAPDFEFQTADGRTHRLSEYRGRKVVLCFGDEWHAMDCVGDPAQARRQFLSWGGGGPLVWINLTSDTKPRPAIEMVQDAEFQYVQGYVPRTAEARKAYDIRCPWPEVTIHVAQDGTVTRK